MLCSDCHREVREPIRSYLNKGVEIRCPYCGGLMDVEVFCDLCGCRITDSYIRTNDGFNYCDECYTVEDIP